MGKGPRGWREVGRRVEGWADTWSFIYQQQCTVPQTSALRK